MSSDATRPHQRPLRVVLARDFGSPNAEARARAKARANDRLRNRRRFEWPEQIERLARMIGLECDEVARELALAEAGQ